MPSYRSGLCRRLGHRPLDLLVNDMNAIDTNAPMLGHNNPPEPTPYEAIKARIDDLYTEAQGWLDGAPVDSSSLAEGVEKLEAMLKAAIKDADEARKVENIPFDEGKAEVQGRYNSLIADTKTLKGTAIRALEACKAALTPWRIKVQDEKDAAAAALRKEADEKAAAAQAARQVVDIANMAAKEASDAQLAEAEKAQRIAKAAEKATTTKTGLRTTYRAVMLPDGLQAAARHIWTNDQDALSAFVQAWADNTVRSFGANAEGLVIPGFEIQKIQEAR